MKNVKKLKVRSLFVRRHDFLLSSFEKLHLLNTSFTLVELGLLRRNTRFLYADISGVTVSEGAKIKYNNKPARKMGWRAALNASSRVVLTTLPNTHSVVLTANALEAKFVYSLVSLGLFNQNYLAQFAKGVSTDVEGQRRLVLFEYFDRYFKRYLDVAKIKRLRFFTLNGWWGLPNGIKFFYVWLFSTPYIYPYWDIDVSAGYRRTSLFQFARMREIWYTQNYINLLVLGSQKPRSLSFFSVKNYSYLGDTSSANLTYLYSFFTYVLLLIWTESPLIEKLEASSKQKISCSKILKISRQLTQPKVTRAANAEQLSVLFTVFWVGFNYWYAYWREFLLLSFRPVTPNLLGPRWRGSNTYLVLKRFKLSSIVKLATAYVNFNVVHKGGWQNFSYVNLFNPVLLLFKILLIGKLKLRFTRKRIKLIFQFLFFSIKKSLERFFSIFLKNNVFLRLFLSYGLPWGTQVWLRFIFLKELLCCITLLLYDHWRNFFIINFEILAAIATAIILYFWVESIYFALSYFLGALAFGVLGTILYFMIAGLSVKAFFEKPVLEQFTELQLNGIGLRDFIIKIFRFFSSLLFSFFAISIFWVGTVFAFLLWNLKSTWLPISNFFKISKKLYSRFAAQSPVFDKQVFRHSIKFNFMALVVFFYRKFFIKNSLSSLVTIVNRSLTLMQIRWILVLVLNYNFGRAAWWFSVSSLADNDYWREQFYFSTLLTNAGFYLNRDFLYSFSLIFFIFLWDLLKIRLFISQTRLTVSSKSWRALGKFKKFWEIITQLPVNAFPFDYSRYKINLVNFPVILNSNWPNFFVILSLFLKVINTLFKFVRTCLFVFWCALALVLMTALLYWLVSFLILIPSLPFICLYIVVKLCIIVSCLNFFR